ncbi:hypothetical protein LX16_4043 [Stackebrandtia albiflava]|uniref:YCII-related domain-containing protein n=1 Tax=Stackebrandtia albiflava TaxID=406432 RepID=A0A562UYE9_9ACTN|nr:YciI family protein [Stackebrandtia albiflava]TWJ10623.1 hypothetical protein LX16_4043 [Stackebrandtia albiflava]
MLMMQGTESDSRRMGTWPPEAVRDHIRFMIDLNAKLSADGELVDAQGLAMPWEARIVKAGPDGTPVVTDGPFPESKEFLAGYWIVEVEDVARAIAIAAEASTAPGPDGEPLNLAVEVRAIGEAPQV